MSGEQGWQLVSISWGYSQGKCWLCQRVKVDIHCLSPAMTCISICKGTRVWLSICTTKTICEQMIWGEYQGDREISTIDTLHTHKIKMIDTKSHLYELMSWESEITDLVGDRIHYQSNDLDENDWDATFPMITFHRLSSLPPQKTTKRVDSFQITAWWETNSSASAVAHQVIKLLHMLKTTTMVRCLLNSETELYDPKTKAFGIALRFVVVVEELDY